MQKNPISNRVWINAVGSVLALSLLSPTPALVCAQDGVEELKVDANGVPEGYILIEGDMLVPAPVGGVAALIAPNLWPDGSPTVIPFQFDTSPTSPCAGACIACPAGSTNACDRSTTCDGVLEQVGCPGAGFTCNQTAMLNAMAVWQGCADLVFTRCTNDNCPGDGIANYITIRDSSNDCTPGSSSQVGRGGAQSLQMNFATASQRTMVHELGHALGFIHEQSRPDRGTACNGGPCVTINCANLCTGVCDGNTNIRAEGAEYGPYDFGSLMHYTLCGNGRSCCGGSQCGTPTCCPDLDADGACDDGRTCPNSPSCRVITVVPAAAAAQWQTPNALGRPDLAVPQGAFAACDPALVNGVLPPGATPNLSCLDALTMSFLYPKANWRFVDGDDACACPHGGGGCSDNGSFACPYEGLSVAVRDAPCGGTLWVQPGSYCAPGTYSKSLTIRAPLGVTLGK